jgi:hypothetical protein
MTKEMNKVYILYMTGSYDVFLAATDSKNKAEELYKDYVNEYPDEFIEIKEMELIHG